MACRPLWRSRSHAQPACRVFRARIVNLANGLLRNRFGWQPRSRALKGPSFFAKAVLQKALRNTSWVKKQRKARNQIEFRLDQNHPGQMVDLPKAA